MTYGNLFKKTFKVFGNMNLSANSVSKLSENEVNYLATLFYEKEHGEHIPKDYYKSTDLKKRQQYVYNSMKNLKEGGE